MRQENSHKLGRRQQGRGVGRGERGRLFKRPVPAIFQIGKVEDIDIGPSLQPSLHAGELIEIRLGGVLGDDREAAALIGEVAVAIEAMGLDALLHEGAEKVCSVCTPNGSLIGKGEREAYLAEIRHTLFFAGPFVHVPSIIGSGLTDAQ